MYFDRFDICEAHYLFYSDYHEGQGSTKYTRLCRLLGFFKPGVMLEYETLSENGKAIYDQLVEREES